MRLVRICALLGALVAAVSARAYFREAFQTYAYGAAPGAPWYIAEDQVAATVGDLDCCGAIPPKALGLWPNSGMTRPIGPLNSGKWIFRFCFRPDQIVANSAFVSIGNGSSALGVRALPGGMIGTVGITPAPANWSHGSGWADVVIILDLTTDAATIYYNGTYRGNGSIAATLTLSQIDVGCSNNPGNLAWVDNISVVKNQNLILQRGLIDNFAAPTDTTYRAPGYGAPTWRLFDDLAVIDKPFGVTFQSACFRPCFGAAYAELQWRMQPLAPNAAADRLSLGVFPTWPWTQPFNLFVPLWPIAATPSVSLGQLPVNNTNILPTMNQNGRLDILSTAWTAFDYFRMIVKPGKCWFGGLVYDVLGDWPYQLPPSGKLEFDPAGSSQADGFMFELGEACGANIDFDDTTDLARAGGSFSYEAFTVTSTASVTGKIASLDITGNGSTATIRGDFDETGPTQIRAYFYDASGNMISELTAPNNQAFVAQRPGGGPIVLDRAIWRVRNSPGVGGLFVPWVTAVLTQATTVAGIPNVKTIAIERVSALATNLSKSLTNVCVTDSAPTTRSIAGISTYFDSAFITSDGNAALSPTEGGIVVVPDSINTVGTLSFDFGQYWPPFFAGGAQSSDIWIDTERNVRRSGAYFQLEERGNVTGVGSDVVFGRLKWTDNLSTFNIFSDFPDFCGTLTVRLFLNGNQVRLQQGVPNNLGSVNIRPMGVEQVVGPTRLFKVKLDAPAIVNIVGAPATTADEIWISPFGSPNPVRYKTKTNLTYQQLDEIVIGDAKSTRKFNFTIAMAGWTGSYAGMPVVVTLTDPVTGIVQETLNTTLAADGSGSVVTALRGPLATTFKTPKGLRKLSVIPQTELELTVSVLLANGDLNNDNEVNSDDFDILVANFGVSGPAGDLTGDSQSDSDDFDVLITHFGLVGDPLF